MGVAFMVFLVFLSSFCVTTTKASFAGMVGGRLKLSLDVKFAGKTMESVEEAMFNGHTIFIYNVFLDQRDLDHLVGIMQRKTSSLSIYNQREWDRFFWSPIVKNGHAYKRITNLVVYGITDFMYLRQLLCKARVFVVSICLESLDAILRSSKII